MLRLQAAAAQTSGNPSVGNVKAPCPKIPPFDESKDNLDAYIERFERFAVGQKWSEDTWAVNLSAFLRGKALDVYSRLSTPDSLNYDKFKNALLKRYRLTEEGYRVKFRICRPEKFETPSQFAARMSSYLHHWVDLSKINKDYVSIVDLLLREQFVRSCSRDLSAYLKEQRISSIDHLAEIAERYVEAHGLSHFTGHKPNGWKNGQKNKIGPWNDQKTPRKNDDKSGRWLFWSSLLPV